MRKNKKPELHMQWNIECSAGFIPSIQLTFTLLYLQQWSNGTDERCTGPGVSELTPTGVLLENRSAAGADFFKERPEPKWKPESFFEYEVSLLIIIAGCFFTKHVIM